MTLRRILGAMLLAVIVYGGFAVWQGLGKMGDELARFAWGTFAAACTLALGNYLLRWLKWEFYLARLDVRGVGRIDSLLTFLSGFVLTVTPGKVGEVFKSLVLFETHGVPVERTAPIVVAERLTDVIGVVVLIVIGSLGFRGGLVWAGLGAVSVGLVLAVTASKRAAHGIIRIVETLPGPFAGIGPKLHAAYDSLATLVKASNLVIPTLLSIAAWSLECAALWVILRGLGQATRFGLATFFYATSTLAGALVPVPGGLGVTETSLRGQLHELGHVAPATSTAAMILVRFATLWFAVLVGFLALSLLKRRHPGLLAGRGTEVASEVSAGGLTM
ncbi:MAG TPA: lysylphosphatidylglycerol synthase transmembrane domain-containing protein [Polyangiaceae bacterium]|nr:lysylphosphatidylglycerol synthase transmembrane domain-containing protein [Polyangiaceae bacterium]